MADIDPVIAMIRAKKPRPFHWNGLTYKGFDHIYEVGRAYGIRSGIIAPIRPGGRRRLSISLDSPYEIDGTPAQIADKVAALGKFAHGLAGAMIARYDHRSKLEVALNEDEKEMLKRLFGGCPPHDLPFKLRRGHDFVRITLTNAARKLGTNNPDTAAALAWHLGVLT
ncbi:autoinducer binding domain-containing protein [Chitinimonas koreensis]|uniref:autoinducer binding domain-containing protein n=1 Tax=Chitinimonas koreensis TaxID=356302 RepID=UPI0016542D26|nr:autoinducer binding domain-containing protein [Chitinimonas koreensis]QNM96407.1 autoinducer binding domain-containing protein [Chitinimonas koreensis]